MRFLIGIPFPLNSPTNGVASLPIGITMESDNEDLESEELDEIGVEDNYENSEYPKYNSVDFNKKKLNI